MTLKYHTTYCTVQDMRVDYDDPKSLGVYSNDLAFHPKATDESYSKDTLTKNSLSISWRMVEEGGQLKPACPVCVLTRDLLFTNSLPIEIGNTYSWEYWAAHRRKHRPLY